MKLVRIAVHSMHPILSTLTRAVQFNYKTVTSYNSTRELGSM